MSNELALCFSEPIGRHFREPWTNPFSPSRARAWNRADLANKSNQGKVFLQIRPRLTRD